MKRVNEITGLNVTVSHQFHDEVNYYRKHIWRCDVFYIFKLNFIRVFADSNRLILDMLNVPLIGIQVQMTFGV